MMFQRFLDAADYWFVCSDDSSAGSYDPTRECFVVVVDNQADNTNVAGAGDGEAPKIRVPAYPRTRGQTHLPPSQRGPRTSTRN
jgi:hypothetical protein